MVAMAMNQTGETPAEREQRREALLKYGPLFAPALRFPFDAPMGEDSSDAAARPKKNKAE
jgi:hypothetical protein